MIENFIAQGLRGCVKMAKKLVGATFKLRFYQRKQAEACGYYKILILTLALKPWAIIRKIIPALDVYSQNSLIILRTGISNMKNNGVLYLL